MDTQLEKYLDKIDQKIDQSIANDAEIKGDIRLLQQTVQQAVQQGQRHEHLLRGNGDIGLMARVKKIEQTVTEDHELLHGFKGKPGMKGEMQQLNRAYASIGRVAWLMIGTIITGLIGLWMFGGQ